MRMMAVKIRAKMRHAAHNTQIIAEIIRIEMT
jgi:hypothetical protein